MKTVAQFALAFLLPAILAAFPRTVEADDILVFFDRSQFLQATGSSLATQSFTLAGTNLASYASGSITFEAINPSTINLADWTAEFGGVDIALNGKEDLNIISDSPVFAMGFDFDDPAGGSGFSEFTVTAKLAGTLVDVTKFHVTEIRQAKFVGVWSPVLFDRLEIRETTNVNENEYFGAAYTGLNGTGQVRKIKPVEASATNDHFGYAVAVDGDQALVGEPYDGAITPQAGAASILQRQPDGSWAVDVSFFNSDGESFNLFGGAVALHEGIAVIGAEADTVDAFASGSVFIYEQQPGGTWLPKPVLVPLSPLSGAKFGHSISVSGDRLLVGAPSDSEAGSNAGAAYVFERQLAGHWLEIQKLQPDDLLPGDEFGWALGIEGDTAIISSRSTEHGSQGKGTVYVFSRQQDETWLQTDELALAGTADLVFGVSLDLDGDTLAVGRAGSSGTSPPGQVHMFQRAQSSGKWSWTGEANPGPGATRDFGKSVALNGNTLLVGSTETGNFNADHGVVYLFRRNSAGIWQPAQTLFAWDGAASDQFGLSVDLNGNQALIGAPGDDDLNTWSGAVYFQDLDHLFEIYGGIFKSSFEDL